MLRRVRAIWDYCNRLDECNNFVIVCFCVLRYNGVNYCIFYRFVVSFIVLLSMKVVCFVGPMVWWFLFLFYFWFFILFVCVLGFWLLRCFLCWLWLWRVLGGCFWWG